MTKSELLFILEPYTDETEVAFQINEAPMSCVIESAKYVPHSAQAYVTLCGGWRPYRDVLPNSIPLTRLK
jgi:hypothetical protein